MEDSQENGLEVFYQGPLRADCSFIVSLNKREYLLLLSVDNHSLNFCFFNPNRKEKLIHKVKSHPKFVRTIVRPIFKNCLLSIEDSFNDYQACVIYRLTSKGLRRYLRIIVQVSSPYSIFSLDKYNHIVFLDGTEISVYSLKKRAHIQKFSISSSIEILGIRYLETINAIILIGQEAIYLYAILDNGIIGNIACIIQPYIMRASFNCFSFVDEFRIFLLLKPPYSQQYDEDRVYMGVLEIASINSHQWIDQCSAKWEILGEPYLSVFPQEDVICCKTLSSAAVYKLSDKTLVNQIKSPGLFLNSSKTTSKMFFNQSDKIVCLSVKQKRS